MRLEWDVPTPDQGAIRVIHKHRIGKRQFARVSELTYSGNRPVAVLTWFHSGGERMPCVWVELDPARLRTGANRRLFFYDGVTTDPRFENPDQRAV